MLRFYTLLLAVLLVATSIVLWTTSRDFMQSGENPRRVVSSTGKAEIGGSFSLVDQHKKIVTNVNFRGKYMLVFFGFSMCPDQCPTALKSMSEALGILGGKAEHIVPIFISVDPERDTPDALADYAKNFHPRLVALTGSEVEIKQAADAYKAIFAKVDPAQKQDYLINHSSIIYLMGPDGEYIKHFSYEIAPDELAKALEPYTKAP